MCVLSTSASSVNFISIPFPLIPQVLQAMAQHKEQQEHQQFLDRQAAARLEEQRDLDRQREALRQRYQHITSYHIRHTLSITQHVF